MPVKKSHPRVPSRVDEISSGVIGEGWLGEWKRHTGEAMNIGPIFFTGDREDL